MPKPATSTEDQEDKPLSVRESSLAQIDAARREFLVDEGFKAEDFAPADDAAASGAPALAEPAAAAPTVDAGAAPTEGQAEGAAETPPAEKLIDVTVDGKAYQVTEKQLKEGFQVAETARSRLAVATNILERARAQSGAGQGAHVAPAAGAGAAGDGQPAAADGLPPEPDYTALTKSLQFDDPEVSAKTLKTFVEQTNARAEAVARQHAQPPIDPRLIAQQVLDKVEWDATAHNLARDHADILAVPELASMAGQIAKQAWDADMKQIREQGGGNRRSFQEYFDGGIARVREIANRPKAATTDGGQDSAGTNGTPTNGNGHREASPTPTVTLDPARTILKRSLPAQPTPRRAASPGAAQPQQVEFTESADLARRQSAIQEMTASRRPKAPRAH